MAKFTRSPPSIFPPCFHPFRLTPVSRQRTLRRSAPDPGSTWSSRSDPARYGTRFGGTEECRNTSPNVGRYDWIGVFGHTAFPTCATTPCLHHAEEPWVVRSRSTPPSTPPPFRMPRTHVRPAKEAPGSGCGDAGRFVAGSYQVSWTGLKTMCVCVDKVHLANYHDSLPIASILKKQKAPHTQITRHISFPARMSRFHVPAHSNVLGRCMCDR